jgi:hypothetical protein
MILLAGLSREKLEIVNILLRLNSMRQSIIKAYLRVIYRQAIKIYKIPLRSGANKRIAASGKCRI